MGVRLAGGSWPTAEDTHACKCRPNSRSGSGKPGPFHDLSRFDWMSFEEHLEAPTGEGALADVPHSGAAGGAVCGDLVRVAVRVEGDRVAEAGFDASGCSAARAAGSAVVELVEGEPLLAAALVTPDDVAEALGGLLPASRHAAELAADALHRALGA